MSIELCGGRWGTPKHTSCLENVSRRPVSFDYFGESVVLLLFSH